MQQLMREPNVVTTDRYQLWSHRLCDWEVARCRLCGGPGLEAHNRTRAMERLDDHFRAVHGYSVHAPAPAPIKIPAPRTETTVQPPSRVPAAA